MTSRQSQHQTLGSGNGKISSNKQRNVRYWATENLLFLLQSEKSGVILLVILLFSVNTKEELLPSTYFTAQEIQLVSCLTYISHRYFAPGRSVVISSPATYRDIQQELIAEIQRSSIWPVVVTVDGNISKYYKTDFIDGDGSYIILIQMGISRVFRLNLMG